MEGAQKVANEEMRVSQRGIALVKEFEGLYLQAYRDPVGIWTIGYGHTQGVYAGMVITETKANEFLAQDLLSHASGIFRYVSVQLNQNQFDALASFHFNLGADILKGTTLLTYINSKNWTAAANEMKRYVHAGGAVLPGLVRRRNAEAELFLDQLDEEKITNRGARAMFVYIKKMKNGSGQYWGVNGTNRFYFGTMAEVDHYKKIVKGNGGDTTVNTWEEGSVQMKVVEMMAPTVTVA